MIWKVGRIWGESMADRPACQSSIEARHSTALSEMKKGRSNPQTRPGPNTLAGKTGGDDPPDDPKQA